MMNLAIQAGIEGLTKGEPSRREENSYISKVFIEWESAPWFPKRYDDPFLYPE